MLDGWQESPLRRDDSSTWRGGRHHARALLRWVGLVFLLWSTGCSGCGDESCDPACEYYEACIAGSCVLDPDLLCVPTCGDGEFCEQGQCIPVVSECSAFKEQCDPRQPVSGQFFCVDWDGFARANPAVCSTPCADGTCPEDSTCYVLSTSEDPTCATTDDCTPGRRCVGGFCRPTACRPAECDGFLSGLDTCARLYRGVEGFENGAACYPGDPGAGSFCAPGGQRYDGNACITHQQALQSQDFANTCAPGLACVQSSCKVACDADERCVDTDHRCLLADQDFVAPGIGFCGKPCEAFSLGQCGDGQKCLPVTATEGYCVAAGPEEAFAACAPGATGQCVEGTVCTEYPSTSLLESIGRCMPMCNVTVAPSDLPGAVSSTDQARRDATCPQPPQQTNAFVRVEHLAQPLGALDVYLDQETSPRATIEYEQSVGGAQGALWFKVPPGLHTVAVREAGASVIDAPLAELVVSLRRQDARWMVFGAPDPSTAEVIRAHDVDMALAETEPPVTPGPGAVRVVHTLGDLAAVDIIATAPQAPHDAQDAIMLAAQLAPSRAGVFLDLPAGTYDLHVRAGGTTRVLLASVQHDAAAPEVWVLRGTADPDDLASATQLTRRAWTNIEPEVRSGPALRCTDPGNKVYGFCEQICDDLSVYGASCDGPQMACQPAQLPGSLGWSSLCRPGGALAIDATCDPNAQPSPCAEGLYCMPLGVGASEQPGESVGRCAALCDTTAEGEAGCPGAMRCDPLDEEFNVGQCAWLCEPGADYTDAICPLGLQTCRPRARLLQQASTEVPPTVETRSPICTASGDVALGEACSGDDCAPGLECVFARSQQGDLTTSLLSQYLGNGADPPTCTPLCDPFEEQPTRGVSCSVDETCLVAYPWSAEAGHCATIVERADPFAACTTPGLACGEDSVCVVDGGAPFCLRLCPYTGGSSDGGYARSTCPEGYGCAPLVNDVGYCIAAP